MAVEYLQTLSLSAQSYMLSVPTPEDTINVIMPPDAGVQVSFATAPTGAVFSYAAGSLTITTTSNYTPVNSAITFTAMVVLPNSPAKLAVTEYFWDFGDGVTGYGNPVTHTYKLITTNCQAVLRVTDNYGRHWYCRNQIYLT